MYSYRQIVFVALSLLSSQFGKAIASDVHDNWHQPAGPNGNWTVEGTPPIKWSATRGENILWRTSVPEAGMSSVSVWDDRVFTTTHVPIKAESDRKAVTDIIGLCLDANTGKIRWKVELPGTAVISLAGGFTDGTVFAPITDGKHVWFFNRCGSMGCYDMDGNEVWKREWKPRFKHNNRQAEPFLVDNTILYVEVANKEAGAKMQKWTAPGVVNRKIEIPAGVEPTEVWTYIHGIDAKTGKILWRENVGTSIHTTPVIGRMLDGTMAISHARGGPHGVLEKPYGHSLTSLAPGKQGQTVWSTPLNKYDPSFGCHWNGKYAFGFQAGEHVVMDGNTGDVLRRQPLYKKAELWKYDASLNDWQLQKDVAIKAGKGHPNTNQANIVSGDWHWFLSHNVHYIGRIHIETGEVQYLEVPAQLIASTNDRTQDKFLWKKGSPNNRPLNARGFAVGDKGHAGTGWGHISAASPIVVGKYLLIPVVTGTVYVLDTSVADLSPKSLVAVNDLGRAEETWTLASFSFAKGRLFAHTMREVLCISE